MNADLSTNTKHTPGPWTVEPRDRCFQHGVMEYCGPFVVLGADGGIVVEVQDDGEPGEAIANVGLIAAALDLLAACKMAVATLSMASLAGESLYAAPVTEKIRAVIAKAEGGAS